MSKVVVTGADGFIGSHLTEALLDAGHEVKALVKYSSDNRLNNLTYLGEDKLSQVEIVKGDIKDPEFCNRLLNDCNVVFHLASLISIPYSYINPNDFLQTNIVGTVNLLNSARRVAGLERFIHTSTSEVYGSAKYVPIDENHPLQPQSPYSASKMSADSCVMSYYLSFGLPVTIVRPFNTYGPRQSMRAIIPKIIGNLLDDTELKLGNMHTRRDFIFVKDTVNGFISGLHDSCIGEAVNIGTGRNVSMKALLEMVGTIAGKEPNYVVDESFVRPQKSEVSELLCNYGKINSLTRWQPKYDLMTGLKLTVDWFKEFHREHAAGQFEPL